MIVRGNWPYEGDDGRDPRQSFSPLVLAFAITWAAATLVMLAVLALRHLV